MTTFVGVKVQWLKFIEDSSMVKPRNKGYDL